MIAVSVERNRFLQQRRDLTHAEAVLPSQAPQIGRLVYLWKTYDLHDADGKTTETRHERAGSITILRVVASLDVVDIPLDIAVACGYRTTQMFRDAWQDRHPRSPLTSVVWFALGDWRDRDTFMNYTGRSGGDFTQNSRRALDPDAPVLTREEIDALAGVNLQKDTARRARESATLAKKPAWERLRDLVAEADRLGPAAKKEIHQEIRIIKQRLKRAEGRRCDDG